MAISRELLLAEREKKEKILRAQVLICGEISKLRGMSWAVRDKHTPWEFYDLFSYTFREPEDMAEILDQIKIAPLIKASGLTKAEFIKVFNEVGHEAIDTVKRKNDRIWREVWGNDEIDPDNSPNNPWAHRWDFDDD